MLSKKLIFFLFCLSFATFSLYADVEKDFRKYIGKYDVADEAKAIELNSPIEYWRAVMDNNEQLFKFIKDIGKGKGAEKEALRKAKELPRFYPQYDRTIINSLQGFCDTILLDMGISSLGLNCSLHIVNADELNAFCALTEDGFAMCLSSALLNQQSIDYYIIMGYVAHEFTHGVLLHHIRSLYAEAKERRKNELLGYIAAGLNGFAAGMEAYNASAYGIPPSGTDYGSIIAGIGTDIRISTLKYSFKYSREQEYEADLLAYRFLENLGCADKYIDALRILGSEYDTLYSDYSDHPTITMRINFLKFVQQNPELGNKDNKKLKKKRLAAEAKKR